MNNAAKGQVSQRAPVDGTHPALAGREGPMGAVADAVRRLIDLTVTNTAGPDVLDEVTARLQSAADLLAAHVPTEGLPRFVEPPDDDPGDLSTRSMHAAMPYDPVVGRFNPVAPPVMISFEPPVAVGVACFTTPYEGGPGWVHGAAIAAAFDIVLTAANHLAGSAGPTVWLTVRFRRPTLIGVDARFEAEVVSSDSRRVTSRGRLVQDGVVCVEAEGEFAVVSPRNLRKLAERRVPSRHTKDGEDGTSLPDQNAQ